LTYELIRALEDLCEFDKEFFDKSQINQKNLKRFILEEPDISIESKLLAKQFILIDTPTQCYSLQENITFILKETCLQIANVVHDRLYEKFWFILCEQLKYGERNLKIITYNLILSILDLRVLPLKKFDCSKECYLYFMDCLFATFELIFTDETQSDMGEMKTENDLEIIAQNEELSLVVSLITNKLFNNHQLIINNLDDINSFLVQIIDIIRIANFNRSELLCNSFFAMIFNLTQQKNSIE
jgi:hypothetical protein